MDESRTGFRPKMTDVAAVAGVSSATVSRALSSPHLVAAETRRRVDEAIAKLGFSPSQAARTLASNRNEAAAVVFLVKDIASLYFAGLIKGASSRANELGMLLTVGELGPDTDPETYIQYVHSHRADGFIVAGIGSDLYAPFLSIKPPGAPQKRVPLVSIGPWEDVAITPTVGIDDFAGAVQMTEFLFELGHRKIAHISGPANSTDATRRRKGFLKAHQDAGRSLDPAALVTGDFSIDSGRRAVRKILQMSERPTAIFAANDDMALGAMSELHQAGLRVPDDFSLVGFDDTEMATIATPQLTTMRQPRSMLGETAVNIFNDLQRGQKAATTVLFPTELVVRQSTRPV